MPRSITAANNTAINFFIVKSSVFLFRLDPVSEHFYYYIHRFSVVKQ